MLPPKIKAGDSLKSTTQNTINSIIDYLHTQRIVGDNKTVFVNQLNSGIAISALPQTSHGGKSAGSATLEHPFQLHIKTDENGKQQIPTMGCYGIGVDRALASIIEEHHDDNGIVWPMTAAPYQVAIVPIKYDGTMQEVADTLYKELQAQGIEVLLDDRNERPGVKFKDADLMGAPIRITVGKGAKDGLVEYKLRSGGDSVNMTPDEALEKVYELVK